MDQLDMRVVRPIVANGRIPSIDAAEALAVPGVAAVWTAADVAGIPPIDFRLTRTDRPQLHRPPILVHDRVR